MKIKLNLFLKKQAILYRVHDIRVDRWCEYLAIYKKEHFCLYAIFDAITYGLMHKAIYQSRVV
jgi:hypothetical protein